MFGLIFCRGDENNINGLFSVKILRLIGESKSDGHTHTLLTLSSWPCKCSGHFPAGFSLVVIFPGSKPHNSYTIWCGPIPGEVIIRCCYADVNVALFYPRMNTIQLQRAVSNCHRWSHQRQTQACQESLYWEPESHIVIKQEEIPLFFSFLIYHEGPPRFGTTVFGHAG